MKRINAFSLSLDNAEGIPVRVFANESVRIEAKAVDELRDFLSLQTNLTAMHSAAEGFFGESPEIQQVSISPDFHKGAGIPIGTAMLSKGFVAPQAIGKDVNCGMRLLVTDWDIEEIKAKLPQLKKKIRHVFFEGGRGIVLDRVQKLALLEQGLIGLVSEAGRHADKGIWQDFRQAEEEKDLARVTGMGSLQAAGIFDGLRNYVDHDHLSWDSQLGSIGGGNHFVEIQQVEAVLDGPTAYAWGIRPGAVVVMIHSGCVSIGHPVSSYLKDLMRSHYPGHVAYPANGIFALPSSGRHAEAMALFRMALYNAANFAFANRLLLGIMLRNCMEACIGPGQTNLVYDSGHNMIEERPDGSFLHRKGAAPARGPKEMSGTPFEWTGEPVLIPGSMGSASYVMAGMGNPDALSSASHGAGRSMSRGDALQGDEERLQAFLKEFHIVTPIDPNDPMIRGRRDILQKWEQGILQEAPWAFKDVGPVVQTQVDAGIVRPVAKLSPILTVKG